MERHLSHLNRGGNSQKWARLPFCECMLQSRLDWVVQVRDLQMILSQASGGHSPVYHSIVGVALDS
jgi:hypothetical protein